MTMVTPRLGRVLAESVERGFVRRVVTIDPGASRDYERAEWHDALVVITAGSVRLEGGCGAQLVLGRGAVLWLADAPVHRLTNPGAEPAVLVAVSRPAAAETAGPLGQPDAGLGE